MMISPRDAKRKTETMPVVIVAGALGLLLGLLLGGKRALKGGLAGSGASVLAGKQAPRQLPGLLVVYSRASMAWASRSRST